MPAIPIDGWRAPWHGSAVSTLPATSVRLAGFDVARAIAIFGMVTVHFTLVMTDGTTPSVATAGWLEWLDGRPAAAFMLLAGIGVAFLERRTVGPDTSVAAVRACLRRRGLFLLAAGTLNLAIWAGDILRVYGISMMLVTLFIGRRSRVVLAAAASFLAVFIVLFLTLDYGRHWDWAVMKYHGVWTPEGFVRSLFFDGFRSVFPWTGILLIGLVTGRLDWASPRVARRAVVWGLLGSVVSGVVSAGLLRWARQSGQGVMDTESWTALLGLKSMPPLPVFLLHAVSTAFALVGGCTLAAQRWPHAFLIRALAATGKMAFTWYVVHIVLGLGGLILVGWLQTSLPQALLASAAFCALATAVSLWFDRTHRRGPLETLLRKCDGSGREPGGG